MFNTTSDWGCKLFLDNANNLKQLSSLTEQTI